MNEDRDPMLQSVFAEAERDLDAALFTAQVMSRTRFLRYRNVAPWIFAAIVLTAGAWYLAVPVDFSILVARGLTVELLDLGSGWLAWVVSPINNVASLLVLGVKAIRMFRSRIIRSYASW